MKTVVIIIVIVAAIFVFDILTISFFKNETDFFDNEINEIINDIEKQSYSAAAAKIEKLNNHWEDKKVIWNMLCDHSEAEEISKLLSTSTSSFEHERYFVCTTSLKNLNLTVEFAGDRYNLLIDNIS